MQLLGHVPNRAGRGKRAEDVSEKKTVLMSKWSERESWRVGKRDWSKENEGYLVSQKTERAWRGEVKTQKWRSMFHG